MRKLEPCPLCAGEVELDTMRPFLAYHTGKRLYAISIQCAPCGLELMACDRDEPGVQVEDVVERWNRRPPPEKATNAIVSRLTTEGEGKG